jgi:transposase
MRFIGLDVHRTFAEVAVVANGQVHSAGRVAATATGLEAFAKTLTRADHVVLEATGNTYAIARVLVPHVGRVVISNPLRTRAIAAAKIKTDKVDARVLAQLLAADFLPEVWLPDETTHVLRRHVARRAQLLRQRTRLKNQTHAVLHRNLIPPCPATDLFGQRGRAWLRGQELPVDEGTAVAAYLRALDFAGEELAHLDAALARAVGERPEIRRLLTVPGIDMGVAAGLLAAVGDIHRFATAQKLVGYIGLDPRVRQSGLQPARHGPITKQGRAHARGLLVEAAWAASRTPGPLRAFFRRICTRRGPQVAAVATARKLVILVWHMLTKEQDYLWARPSLTAHKLRRLELRVGAPARRGRRRGPAYAYNLPELRERERALTVQGERAYQRLVAHWQSRGPKGTGAGATSGERR